MAIADNTWICHFVTEMCRQLTSYNSFPLEKVTVPGSRGTGGLAAPVPPRRVRRGRADPALEAFRKHRPADSSALGKGGGNSRRLVGWPGRLGNGILVSPELSRWL